MNLGDYDDLDSWLMIERLDMNMDTVLTMYYDVLDEVDNMYIHTHIKSIKSTNDGGLMLVGYADDLNSDIRWLVLAKFNSYLNIEEAHAHNLHLAVAYPNPGGDVMNIRTGLRNAVLSVYDINGRKIHEQEITDDVTSVDASNWQSGTYIWKLKTENGKLTFSFNLSIFNSKKSR